MRNVAPGTRAHTSARGQRCSKLLGLFASCASPRSHQLTSGSSDSGMLKVRAPWCVLSRTCICFASDCARAAAVLKAATSWRKNAASRSAPGVAALAAPADGSCGSCGLAIELDGTSAPACLSLLMVALHADQIQAYPRYTRIRRASGIGRSRQTFWQLGW
jgi:hypothetical protein